MSIYSLLDNLTRYITEAVVRIFGPTDDAYPAIGVQPFTGEPFPENSKVDW